MVGSWCEWCFWVLCWDCGFPGYFGLMWGWYNIEFRGVGLGVGVRVGCWWWFTVASVGFGDELLGLVWAVVLSC